MSNKSVKSAENIGLDRRDKTFLAIVLIFALMAVIGLTYWEYQQLDFVEPWVRVVVIALAWVFVFGLFAIPLWRMAWGSKK